MEPSWRTLIFIALVTTGIIAVLGEEQCSSGECDTDQLSVLQVHSKGDSSSAVVQLIITPKDFTDALVSATTDKKVCKKTPKVAGDLFGSIGMNGPNLDGRGVDFAHPTPPHTPVDIIFWSPADALPGILEACCNSTCVSDCACRISRKVGINLPAGAQISDKRFLVVKGNQNNQTAAPTYNKKAPINTIQPTWDQMAKITPKTFDNVFAGLDWKSKCPSGKISDAVVANLKRFTKGCSDDKYKQKGTFLQFIDEFDVAHFNITCPKGCASCSTNHQGPPTGEKFLELVKGDTLCTDTATVRSFMLWYYNSNAYFEGDGWDEPTGDLPGGPESVTVPNLLIEQAGGDSSEFVFFRDTKTCQ